MGSAGPQNKAWRSSHSPGTHPSPAHPSFLAAAHIPSRVRTAPRAGSLSVKCLSPPGRRQQGGPRVSITGMDMILQGGIAGPGTSRCPAGTTTPAGWCPLCQVYSNSTILAARNTPFLQVNPIQCPGLSVLPKHRAGCSPWMWLFRDVERWGPRAALAVTAQAALPALPRAGCPAEWTRLAGSRADAPLQPPPADRAARQKA